jgi:hypothetical protein
MSVTDNLRAARALIEDPKHWTQDDLALNAAGEPAISYEEAVCFCSMGATGCAAYRHGYANGGFDADEFLNKVAQMAGFGTISRFNDAPARTHAEVLAAFDKAIELAEKQP